MPVSTESKASQLYGSGFKGAAALYVHWPFCEKKCPYCDFNSHVRVQVSHAEWRAAYLREIENFAALYPNLSAKSVFFGGGTPSLMEPETVAAILEAIKKHWPAKAADIEVTLEANPSSVEAGRFRAYRAAGVNRLSVGIQSLKDDVLQFLGRLHNAEEALKALAVAQATFDRVSFDLIYARPRQTLADWQGELRQALDFGTSHLSLYQLTIEEGTAFHQQFHRGKFTLPDEDEAAALYETTLALTAEAGLPAYETSNHAVPGMESVHNLAYWQGDYYVGIGPGAHGRLPGSGLGSAIGHMQIKRPEGWLKRVSETGNGLDHQEEIPAADRAVEAIMTGLRLTAGVDLNRWRQLFEADDRKLVDQRAAKDLMDSGHLYYSPESLRLTPKGQPLLNHILGKLIA